MRGRRSDGPPEPPSREELLAAAFRSLSQRALTEAELRGRLERRGAGPEDVSATIERVRELGYLSDAQVAQAEGARRGVGKYRVRATLQRRGVDGELIEQVLQNRDPDDELEAATALLERQANKFRRARDPRSSAYGFLARRGYGGDVIWKAIAAARLGEVGDVDVDELLEDDLD